MKKASEKEMWKYVLGAILCIILAACAVIVAVSLISDSQNNNSLDNLYGEASEKLISFDSYDSLYSSLKKSVLKNDRLSEFIDEDIMYTYENDKNFSSYSFTESNIRTESVYESDIAKTDGNYIYTVSSDNTSLVIISLKGSPEICWSCQIADSSYDRIEELFINGSNLHLIISGSATEDEHYISKTFLRTYDISNPESPVMTHEFEQDGTYVTSKISDNMCFLISDYYLSYSGFAHDMPYYPSINGKAIEPENIFCGRNISDVNYYCMSAVDLKEPGTAFSEAALLNDSCNVCAGDDMFYFTSTDYVSEKGKTFDRTNIMCFSYDSSGISPYLTACVNGSLNDSFSVDEYDGCLRMVLSVWEYTSEKTNISFWKRLFNSDSAYTYQSSNHGSLVILDKDLQIISSTDLSADEGDVEGARFYENSLYFSISEQTSSFYTADLSDTDNITVTEGIKVSGFSNYLHYWKDNMLVGLSHEADDEGITSGFKVCMFDISDPANLAITDKLAVSASVDLIASDYGYKQILVDPEKNLIGFAVEYSKDDLEYVDYYLLTYDDETGFNQLLCENIYSYDYDEITGENDNASSAKTSEEQSSDSSDSKDGVYCEIPTMENVRGFYVGDDFYILDPGNVLKKFSLKNYELESALKLNE